MSKITYFNVAAAGPMSLRSEVDRYVHSQVPTEKEAKDDMFHDAFGSGTRVFAGVDLEAVSRVMATRVSRSLGGLSTATPVIPAAAAEPPAFSPPADSRFVPGAAGSSRRPSSNPKRTRTVSPMAVEVTPIPVPQLMHAPVAVGQRQAPVLPVIMPSPSGLPSTSSSPTLPVLPPLPAFPERPASVSAVTAVSAPSDAVRLHSAQVRSFQ